jgi:predicted outer membrane repeat protein
MLHSVVSALARRRPGRAAKPSCACRRAFRPGVEALEDRCTPAVHWSVTSAADNVNQVGTLRWAVAHAKNGDTIDILTIQTISLTNGELYLGRDVTIDFTAFGNQATISGNHLSRVFEVAPTAHVGLFDLDIIDGTGVANNPNGTKAADDNGGAIFNQGTLALTRCTLSDNGEVVPGTGQVVLFGGGIDNDGSGEFGTPAVGQLTLTRCNLIDNFAAGAGGIMNTGGYVVVLQSNLEGNQARAGESGGALLNTGDGFMVVANSELDFNQAPEVLGGFGGAIFNGGEGNNRLFVLDCTFVGNTAATGGGAIYNNGTLLVIGCQFFGNHAAHGGVIHNEGGYILVLDSIFIANDASVNGGAIFNELFNGATGLSIATVENSVFVNNAAPSGGGIYNDSGATLNLGFSTFVFNFPDHLVNLGTYNDLGGNFFFP